MDVVVLDAGVVIALLDANDPHHKSARSAIAGVLRGPVALVLPASAYAEVLVGPIRVGGGVDAVVDQLIDELPMTVEPLHRQTAREAAALRAKYSNRLRLPDALVVATAIAAGAREILTTDRRWPELPVPISVV